MTDIYSNSIQAPCAFSIRDGIDGERKYDLTIAKIVNDGYRFPKGICPKIYTVYANYICKKKDWESNDLYHKYIELMRELYPKWNPGYSCDVKPKRNRKKIVYG